MNMPPPPMEAPAIPNYLAWSIVAAVLSLCLCCVIGTIPGIVAIVFSTQVNSKLAAGDFDGARKASDNAKIWCWVTTGLCILGLLWTAFSILHGGGAQYAELLRQIEQAKQH